MPEKLRHRVSHSNGGVSVQSQSSPRTRNTYYTTTIKMDNVDDDNVSCASSHSSNSNLSNGSNNSGNQVYSNSNSSNIRRHHKQKQTELEHIDEEHGYDHYEMSSLLDNSSISSKDKQQPTINAKKKKNIRQLKFKSSNILDSNSSNSNSNSNNQDADNTKNNSEFSDRRAKALFLKTAFWITCWYGTSLATLFLNKIILSKPGSSVHVLGMCQMTTAAVLGGWSTFGGAEYIQHCVWRVYKLIPDVIQCWVGSGLVSSTSASSSRSGSRGDHHNNDEGLHSSSPTKAKSDQSSSGTPSKDEAGTSTSGYSFHFVRDMSIVGVLRGITVVLGLIALEHVPVSFVETIKSTAPAFTVIFAKLILHERTHHRVMLTLLPIVAGLILCSASELRFDTIGFVAAFMNNCADCVQNVMSKRMLTHLKPTQLQFYTSVAALALQAPFVVRDATGLIRNWIHPIMEDTDMEDVLLNNNPMEMIPNTEDDHVGSLLHHGQHGEEMSLTKLLIIDSIFYHLQSVSAYCTMGCMSPVSQSVANTLKRALLVWASILYFGNPVTNSGILGIMMVVGGVFLYNHVRRIYQS